MMVLWFCSGGTPLEIVKMICFGRLVDRYIVFAWFLSVNLALDLFTPKEAVPAFFQPKGRMSMGTIDMALFKKKCLNSSHIKRSIVPIDIVIIDQ